MTTAVATRPRKVRKAISPAEKERRAAARKETAEALQAGLAAQVAEMAAGNAWQQYLDFAGSFHNYSFRNTMLIMIQRPDATRVAGFRAWQEKGRQVRKGEKAIQILGFASKIVVNEETGKEEKKVWFPVVSVFAQEQTDEISDEMIENIKKGNPKAKAFSEVPKSQTQRLQGEDPTDILGRVAKFVADYGWNFALEPVPGSSNGFTTLDGSKRVVVDSDLSPAQKAKTALHEAAHMILHTNEEGMKLDRATMELEAESASYVASKMLGLDSEGYSIGYLTNWSAGDPEAVKATAERVLKAAHQIIDSLDPQEEEAA